RDGSPVPFYSRAEGGVGCSMADHSHLGGGHEHDLWSASRLNLSNWPCADRQACGVIFWPHPRQSLAVGFPTGTGLHRRDLDQNIRGVASGTAPRGIWLMGPARPKGKAYAKERKTYLLQSRQFS